MQYKLWITIGISIIIIATACTPPALEVEMPEGKRRVLNSLRVFEKDRVENINMRHLATFENFRSTETIPSNLAASKSSILQKKYIQKAIEHFNSETLGEEASVFSFNSELNLLAVSNESKDVINIYRIKDVDLVEVELLYMGIEDMELRLKNKGLGEEASLYSALQKGAFDVGSVFMIKQEEDVDLEEGGGY
ncbi:MAG: hypothetical protein HQM14_13060 [SAR324 cluster bacterium]|nr:hypothetical protein [SAR324 cluster bacterium]